MCLTKKKKLFNEICLRQDWNQELFHLFNLFNRLVGRCFNHYTVQLRAEWGDMLRGKKLNFLIKWFKLRARRDASLASRF